MNKIVATALGVFLAVALVKSVIATANWFNEDKPSQHDQFHFEGNKFHPTLDSATTASYLQDQDRRNRAMKLRLLNDSTVAMTYESVKCSGVFDQSGDTLWVHPHIRTVFSGYNPNSPTLFNYAK